jgi:DNA helicase-2/ATP-dependent DNA helicase PcrA
MGAMVDPTRLLAGLNAEQQAAVEAVEGPLLVLAGPGSGKTRVLTHRVAYLVQVAGVEPWRILAVTFTNKAAREMAARLEELIGREALRQLTIGTFHAVCARFLRREAPVLGMDGHFVIYDDDDQLRAIRRALAELNLDEKTYRPRAVQGAISNAKNELLRPGDFAAPTYWHEVAGRVYGRYQELLRASNALDFDDLLLETALLLRDHPEVRERYQQRYHQLLVDEFQDTNTAQYVILKLLAAADRPDAPHNVFVVGDEDQSIYRWRGADWRNIVRLRQDFPALRTILLERNYRSTQRILDAARAVIERNAHRTPKALWTETAGGSPLTVFEAYNETDEAAFIAGEIERRVNGRSSYGDFAVMVRTNAQSRAIEEAFVRRRIPYQLVGATRFYERREIKDVVAYMRLVHNPLDDLALERIINVPARGIGDVAWRTLCTQADRLGVPRWTALQVLVAGDGPEPSSVDRRTLNALGAFHDLLGDLLAAREALPVPELLTLVLERTGYEQWLRDGSEEGEERWENVLELRAVAGDFAGLGPREGLATLLESVALTSDVDGLAEAPDRVTLLTLHAAKGLEFGTVFIAGLEEGILPHARSMEDPEALAEERRLFYVGLTRARQELLLVHAFRRSQYGGADLRERSRFLDDIPLPHLAGNAAPPSGQPAARERQTRWSPAASVGSAVTAATAFRAGDRVRHGTFGEGIVVTSALRDGDEEVTVAFVEAGLKKLLQSYAQLRKA